MRTDVFVTVTACLATVLVVANNGEAFSAPASINETATEEAQQRYEYALAALRADMSDPGRVFELADAAVQSGNTRIAISALESLLLLDPSLSNIKLELGILYMKVGSPAIAERFIREALEDPSAPQEVRDRALQYADAAKVQQQPWTVSGEIYSGLRYETNASAATQNAEIQFIDSFGDSVTGRLDPADRGKPDFSSVTNARVSIAYDLGLQSGSSLVANLGYYGTKYFEQHDLNLDALSIDFGPSLVWGETLGNAWTIRPYVSSSAVYKGEEFYQSSVGFGLSAAGPLSEKLSFQGDATVGYLDYHDTSEEQGLDRKDGWAFEFNPGFTYAFNPSLLLQGTTVAGRVDADAEFENYWQYGAEVSLSKAFDNPFGVDVPVWVTLLAGYRVFDYDGPDPRVSTDAERDNRWNLGLSVSLPVTEKWALVGDVRYLDSSSNYDVNDFDNLSTSLGFAVRF